MKVIIHIGAGKTGTSSIQSTLERNRQELNNQGIDYLGLMLENAVKLQYDWQKASASEIFHALPHNEGAEQVLNILDHVISDAENNNINTIIWSNESLLERSDKVFLIVDELLAKDIEVQVIAYIRNYDAWVQSAYVQWGIKHKTYMGHIKSFSEWYKNKNIKFFMHLEKFKDKYSNILIVKNMEAEKDVVPGFLHLCSIAVDNINVIRTNDSPKNEELFLRALFNDRFDNKVLPMLFDKIVLNKKINMDIDPSEYLKMLLPTDSELKGVNEDISLDKEMLNKLLYIQGEELLGSDDNNLKSTKVNNGKLITLLAQVVIEQSSRIHRLEKTIREMT